MHFDSSREIWPNYMIPVPRFCRWKYFQKGNSTKSSKREILTMNLKGGNFRSGVAKTKSLIQQCLFISLLLLWHYFLFMDFTQNIPPYPSPLIDFPFFSPHSLISTFLNFPLDHLLQTLTSSSSPVIMHIRQRKDLLKRKIVNDDDTNSLRRGKKKEEKK